VYAESTVIPRRFPICTRAMVVVPCAQIGAVSEFERHEDRVFLLEADGSTKEGIMLLGGIVLN
jgi:hypothetical protein